MNPVLRDCNRDGRWVTILMRYQDGTPQFVQKQLPMARAQQVIDVLMTDAVELDPRMCPTAYALAEAAGFVPRVRDEFELNEPVPLAGGQAHLLPEVDNRQRFARGVGGLGNAVGTRYEDGPNDKSVGSSTDGVTGYEGEDR